MHLSTDDQSYIFGRIIEQKLAKIEILSKNADISKISKIFFWKDLYSYRPTLCKISVSGVRGVKPILGYSKNKFC